MRVRPPIVATAALALLAMPLAARAQSFAHEPGTGQSGPASSAAANIEGGDTRGEIAPHLPTPGVDGDGPEAFLRAADRALAAHQTGEAQQALEMAETRLLDRSTPMDASGRPDQNPRVMQVNAALRALGRRDYGAAHASIQAAMGGPGAMPPGMGMGMGMAPGARMAPGYPPPR